MGQRVVGFVLTAIALTSASANLKAQQAAGVIRADGSALERLIGKGVERSVTFRAIVSALENTDVVVYVRFARCDGNVRACLIWMADGAGPRRLLIRLDRFGRSEDEMTALLAHELHHASEVASDHGVTDARAFEKLFAARGWKGPHGFETAVATDVERCVQAELLGNPRGTMARPPFPSGAWPAGGCAPRP